MLECNNCEARYGSFSTKFSGVWLSGLPLSLKSGHAASARFMSTPLAALPALECGCNNLLTRSQLQAAFVNL